MKTSIVPVQNSVLKAYIQYFIFFEHDSKAHFSYQTFPNTNLCLAIYRENKVEYKSNKNENICIVGSGRNAYSSRLLGFHQQPFKVDINASLDQICILFHPAGLRAFSNVGYAELLDQSEVFESIFGNQTSILEFIFENNDSKARSALLEGFLIERLISTDRGAAVLPALDYIYKRKGDVTVFNLARSLKINESTLYRSFKAVLGQSPKEFIQTVRFRNVLGLLLAQECKSLTELTYSAMFYDQSHLIKDFKSRTGTVPNALSQKIRLEQHALAWVIDP
ncbi:AraC-like DNA-binding protein [Pedobacter duraquae]|uniref:AraC-like DNA-binding protein n=1 Tax=Pedobacter duraquae TaxID=425511 RepID=A0A4R6IGK2_9SPHI|nr:AraC-like DNA-binding protein [Pedobacter duraquae]